MRKVNNIWSYSLLKIDDRYPNIKKTYPGAKYMDFSGRKFKNLDDAMFFRKRDQDYKRRKNKPEIRISFI